MSPPSSESDASIASGGLTPPTPLGYAKYFYDNFLAWLWGGVRVGDILARSDSEP